MFHSAALKLTLWYLGIIMALSISLSVVIYNLSSDQLHGNNRRQDYFLNDRLPEPGVNNFNHLRAEDFSDTMRRLRANLLAFNILVLLAGGAASYALSRRTLEPIEDALDAQKRFTGDASHELRTPLTIMQTENEVALRDPKLSKQEAVAQIKSNLEEVAKLKSLSDGLLKLASFEQDKLPKQKVALANVVEAVRERWQASADAKRITLNFSPVNAHIVGDRDSLIELFSVLVDNAIKYSPAGTTVSMQTTRAAKNINVSVADQGDGISAKDLPQVFERFYRADRSRSGSAGYGLGLSIAKRIIELHDGSIEVKSALKKGSTFTVSLPTA